MSTSKKQNKSIQLDRTNLETLEEIAVIKQTTATEILNQFAAEYVQNNIPLLIAELKKMKAQTKHVFSEMHPEKVPDQREISPDTLTENE